jgi:hypothetical protein
VRLFSGRFWRRNARCELIHRAEEQPEIIADGLQRAQAGGSRAPRYYVGGRLVEAVRRIAYPVNYSGDVSLERFAAQNRVVTVIKFLCHVKFFMYYRNPFHSIGSRCPTPALRHIAQGLFLYIVLVLDNVTRRSTDPSGLIRATVRTTFVLRAPAQVIASSFT